MEKTLTCPKHSWQLGCRKFDPDGKLVGVIRRCVNCGREEQIWEELPATVEAPLTIQSVVQLFRERLEVNFKTNWAEAKAFAEYARGYGSPWAGILLKSLEATFKEFEVELKL